METIYEKYMALPIDKGLLCLEYGDIAEPYFCYPVNAKPIGFEGCILYCFLPEYGEMVFACNPESCVDQNVYPLAANFEDFIRLILACGTANPLEQIVWMDKNKFEEHMANEEKILTDEQRTAAQQLQRALSLLPIENPFEYVKSIQKDFDGSKIQYSDEYYEVTGIENPKGTNTQDKHLVEFEPVVFEFNRKQDSDKKLPVCRTDKIPLGTKGRTSILSVESSASCGASFSVSRRKLHDRECFDTSFRQGSYTPLRRLCVYPLWTCRLQTVSTNRLPPASLKIRHKQILRMV